MRITQEQNQDIDVGELIRRLREERGISRGEMAEKAGISLSHLEKIEAGLRSPGMSTFLKIMTVLDVTIGLYKESGTVKDSCARTMTDILMESTDKKAVFLTKMMKHMAEELTLVM